MLSCVFPPQVVLSKDGNPLPKPSSGIQSGGEEEQDEEPHTPLPPPMEIIKDSAQDDKVRGGHRGRDLKTSLNIFFLFNLSGLTQFLPVFIDFSLLMILFVQSCLCFMHRAS